MGRNVVVSKASIASYLDRHRPFPATLCVSDTHLLPEDSFYADDAPNELLALLREHPRHRVFVLGDFIESLALTEVSCFALLSSRRLHALFAELAKRELKILAGNHDTRAIPALRRMFGGKILAKPSFRDGGLVFLHGHEHDVDTSGIAAVFGQLGVPLLVTLDRLGVRLPLGRRNDAIAARSVRAGQFCVFGHTHQPELGASFANTGCFLRNGVRSFITIERDTLTLWRREP